MKTAWRQWLVGAFLMQAVIALGWADVVEAKRITLGDVTLTDGRTFKSVVVMSQSATALSVKHAGGLTKLDKKLLPPEWQAQFPVDEELALKEQAASQAAREQAIAAEQERQRKAAERARLAAENAAKAAAARPAAQSVGQAVEVRNAISFTAPTSQEQQARSPHGLFIVRWYQSGSDLYLTVRNASTSSYKFDFHQVQGLVQDSGAIVAPSDVIFKKTEVANYWLDGGKEQTFRLVFPGQPRFAAVSWTGTEEWRLSGSPYAPAATSKETALQQSREVAVATKAANKASSAQREAEYNAKLLEKKVGK